MDCTRLPSLHCPGLEGMLKSTWACKDTGCCIRKQSIGEIYKEKTEKDINDIQLCLLRFTNPHIFFPSKCFVFLVEYIVRATPRLFIVKQKITFGNQLWKITQVTAVHTCDTAFLGLRENSTALLYNQVSYSRLAYLDHLENLYSPMKNALAPRCAGVGLFTNGW